MIAERVSNGGGEWGAAVTEAGALGNNLRAQARYMAQSSGKAVMSLYKSQALPLRGTGRQGLRTGKRQPARALK